MHCILKFTSQRIRYDIKKFKKQQSDIRTIASCNFALALKQPKRLKKIIFFFFPNRIADGMQKTKVDSKKRERDWKSRSGKWKNRPERNREES